MGEHPTEGALVEPAVTIKAVVARVITVPLAAPVALATRLVTERDWLVVTITTSDGATGLGFSYAGYGGGGFFADIVDRQMTPLLLGEDPYATGALWRRLFGMTAVIGRAGAAMRCISAIDIALWDRNAKVAGLPLGKFIGLARTDPTAVYVGSGYYDGGDEVDAVRALARQGYDAIKVKVGRLSPHDERARILAFRDAVGANVELVADANGSWNGAWTAKMQIEAFREADLAFVEDPLPTDDLAAYQQLRRLTQMPVSAGELLTSPYEFARLLDSGAVDIVQVDATACGGVTGFRNVAAQCETKGVALDTHWFPGLHLQLAQTTVACRRVECFADDEIVNFGKIATEMVHLTPRAGRPTGAVGHGVVLKPHEY